MMYHQRDIVEVEFLFPDGTTKVHPALVVSNDTLQEDEQILYLVLISTKGEISPQYSYPLNNSMLATGSFTKPSFAKCQIIAGYTERDIIRRIGSLKIQFFNEILDKVINSIF